VSLFGTLRGLPRRISDSVQREGFARFALRALLSPCYREVGLRAQQYSQADCPTGPRREDVMVAPCDDISEITRSFSDLDHQDVRERITSGERCFVAKVDGEPAGLGWVSVTAAHIDPLRLSLPLRGRELFSHGLYVRASQRNAGAGRAIVDAVDMWAWEDGLRTHLSFVILGRRPFGKNVRYHVATIRTLRLGPFRKFWVSTYGPQAGYWRERLNELRWK